MLRKCKFFTQKLHWCSKEDCPAFCTQKMEIMHLRNGNSVLNKRPMGLGALLNNQVGPWFQKLDPYTLFLSQNVEIEHLFALWAAVSKIMADCQNCHIWAWNLHAWPLAKIPELTHILFYPGAQNWAHSHSTGSGFWHTGWFSKLSYFGMNSRSCTYRYTLFLGERERERCLMPCKQQWSYSRQEQV